MIFAAWILDSSIVKFMILAPRASDSAIAESMVSHPYNSHIFLRPKNVSVFGCVSPGVGTWISIPSFWIEIDFSIRFFQIDFKLGLESFFQKIGIRL